MDEIAHAEVSPGTIHTTQCATCHSDALTFDIVALGDEGVAYMGTIVRCPTCAPAIG